MKFLKMLKPWQIAVLAVLIAGIAGGGYGIYKAVAGPGTVTTTSTLRYAQVSYGNISNTVSASGNLEFSSERELSFNGSGDIAHVYVSEGDTVKAGQKLADIDTSSLILAWSKAKASLLNAQTSLHEVQEDENTTTNDIRTKALAVTSAEYALEAAQEDLDSATLTAPFDGVITSVDMEVGEEKGSITIVDPSAMDISAVVSESDVPSVAVGQQATVSVDALSDIEFSGVVTSLSLTGTTSSGVVSYPVVINITLPEGVQPRSGMSATATIVTEQATNVLVVPNKAITGASTTNPMVTVVANNVSAIRSVKLGLVGESYTEITSGLSYGETVSYNASKTSTSSSSSSSSSGFPGGGMPGGGMMMP